MFLKFYKLLPPPPNKNNLSILKVIWGGRGVMRNNVTKIFAEKIHSKAEIF